VLSCQLPQYELGDTPFACGSPVNDPPLPEGAVNEPEADDAEVVPVNENPPPLTENAPVDGVYDPDSGDDTPATVSTVPSARPVEWVVSEKVPLDAADANAAE
jgi:hypothetical protein